MQKNKQHIEKEEFLSEDMLLKYRQGELLPSEMRRVEALLEKYPLYADALEGYELLDAEKICDNTTFLKASIQAQIDAQSPAKTFYLRQPRMMRVAAAIAFLLVCLFGIYFFAKQNSSVQNEMAQTTAVSNEENKPVAALQTDEKTIEFPQKVEKNEQPKISERKEIASNQVITSKDDMGKIADSEINKPENTASLSGTTVVADTAPLALAKSSPVVEERKMESEVADEQAGKKDRMKSKKMAEKQAVRADLLPTNENLVNLLKKEILLFAKEKNETLKGKLLLTFSTSKEGVAENIVIKESPCLSCNELIIRLVKDAKNLTKNELNQTIEITF